MTVGEIIRSILAFYLLETAETPAVTIVSSKSSHKERVTNFWSGGEDETDGDDDDNYNSWNRFAGKFPIVGGKSAISQDPLLRERWKGEMSKDRGISSERLKENASEMDYSSPTAPGFCGSGEDKDIAGWFRRKSGN